MLSGEGQIPPQRYCNIGDNMNWQAFGMVIFTLFIVINIVSWVLVFTEYFAQQRRDAMTEARIALGGITIVVMIIIWGNIVV
jgi:hypothetical protein